MAMMGDACSAAQYPRLPARARQEAYENQATSTRTRLGSFDNRCDRRATCDPTGLDHFIVSIGNPTKPVSMDLPARLAQTLLIKLPASPWQRRALPSP